MRASRALDIPLGFRGYGWSTATSGGISALMRPSVGHLIREDRIYHVRGGTIERAQGPALCGRQMTGRSPKADPPTSVEREMRHGGPNGRRPCVRCFEAALREVIHECRNEGHKTGGSTWRGGATWGRVWRVRCACGYTEHSNVPKVEAERAWRQHVRDVMWGGAFQLSGERTEPTVFDSIAQIGGRTGNYTADLSTLKDLGVGEAITVHGNQHRRGEDYTVRRLYAPMLVPEEER